MKTLQDIAFIRLNGVYLRDLAQGEEVLRQEEVMTIIKNLGAYGYTLTQEMVEIFGKVERKLALEVYSKLMKTLDRYLGDKGYKPFYKGFPNEVIKKETEELYFYALLHYLFGVQPDSKEDLLKLEVEESKLRKLIQLKLVTREDLKDLLVEMLSSNVVISEEGKEDIEVLLSNLTDEEVQECLDKSTIVIKETLIQVGATLIKRPNVRLNIFDTVTDVLRFIVELSGHKLADVEHIWFRKFSRPELRSLMTILEGIPHHLDDMNRNKDLWKTFFMLNSGKVNWKKYPKTEYSKDALFGEHEYTTVLGEIEEAFYNYKVLMKYGKDFPDIDDKEFYVSLEKLVEKLETRPGHFARNLVRLLTIVGEDYVNYVLWKFENVAGSVNNRVLYQLKDRLLNINKDGLPRMVKIQGKYHELDSEVTLPEDTRLKALEVVKRCIESNLVSKGLLGNVYIDETYKDYMLTTSERGVNEVLHPITMGSKIRINEDAEVLRLYIAWKNIITDEIEDRVDIDLGVSLYGDSLDYKGVVSWHSFDKFRGTVAFSGDIVDAPKGAVEYIDIYDIEKLKEDGVRYVLVYVHDYTGHGFHKVGVNAGIMELTKEEATDGKNWYTTAIGTGFNLTSTTVSTNVLALDLWEKEMIWLDESLDSNGAHHSYMTSKDKQNSALKWAIKKDWTTLYDVLELNAKVRGKQVANKEDADVVFDEVTYENPLPLYRILAEYL